MIILNLNQKLNKKIYIIDCEYLYSTSDMPNYRAMKLASYHKQLGDNVNLIEAEYQITDNYDILYFIKELRETPFPPGDILDDKRTVLMGEQFKIFDDWTDIKPEVAVCRPDYSIYNLKKNNKYSNSSFVQFFCGEKMLKNVQDWHKSKGTNTIIVDNNLWDANPRAVVQCLESLSGEPNIIFLHPIKLKKLLNEDVLDSFFKLKLAKYYKIRYNNNIGESFESACLAVDLMKKIKNRFVYLNVGSIPIKIITKDHWENKDNILYDFERCLKIMSYAQKQQIRINFKYPKMRLASPSWQFFEFFKTWSNHYHSLCYIEALLKGAMTFHARDYATILNNQKWWTTVKIKQAVYLLTRHTELMKEYGFTGWAGSKSTTEQFIDYQKIKEKSIEDNLF